MRKNEGLMKIVVVALVVFALMSVAMPIVAAAEYECPADAQQAEQQYIAAYNRLTSLMAEGKGDTPEAQEAYEEYKAAKACYESRISGTEPSPTPTPAPTPTPTPSGSGTSYPEATLQSFYGEGSYQDGYDFSAYAVQRWGEGGPDNPSLSPDFYLGDSFTPVTTSEFYDPKYTIGYGVVPLASITEIPDHADPRFASNNFVAGQTYGMFTNEGDYVVLQAVDTVEEVVDNYHTIRMTFNWVYVEGGLTGELTISLYPYDKSEFALGDSPTIGGNVLVGGQPIANAQVCTEVRGDAGEYMYGVCHFTDAYGKFSFWLEYGVSIPTGYHGNLVVEADVAYNDSVADQTIYVPYAGRPTNKL